MTKKTIRVWVPLNNWEDIYEIHPDGYVRRTKTQQVLKPALHGAGYHTVSLQKAPRKEQRYVHQLILKQFGPPQPTPKHEPDHKDRNKAHNSIDNLEWKTHKENCANRKNGPPANAKITQDIAYEIRGRLGTTQQKDLAIEYGVCKQTITLIKQERIWPHG